MCGITGYFMFGGCDAKHLSPMIAALGHRGPDSHGQWLDTNAGIALGHSRLSILDLSVAGHQPMLSDSGRYALVFNGEIYNYAILKSELEDLGFAPAWRGHSDTEVLLAYIEAVGFVKALEKCVGMFAIALWDREARTLAFARDRMGEKPLYYGWQGKSLLFGSELKSLTTHPDWQGGIDLGALALFNRSGYVPAPFSIYQKIHKLPPGTFLQVDSSGFAGQLPEPEPYWSLGEKSVSNIESLIVNVESAQFELDRLLHQSISRQMVADVPVGAFLSGGLDSSIVVAIMQAQSERKVKTFSIGFHESAYNEAVYAKAVAKHLQTDHTEVYLTQKQACEIIPSLPIFYDEPFADPSQIPTCLVSQLAQGSVKVALSGDGGDELFSGYKRYVLGRNLWRGMKHIPLPMRNLSKRIIKGISPHQWSILYSRLKWLMPKEKNVLMLGDKMHKLAEMLVAESPDALYQRIITQWPNPPELMRMGNEPKTWARAEADQAGLVDFTDRMMLLDQLSYLPDDILVKVDRAAMGVSLETRIPMLDHDLVEYAWRIPLSMKIRDGKNKWLLRQVLYKYIPKGLIERPKQGFGVPLDEWLRGPLREWADDLLNSQRIREQGYYNADLVQQRWQEHVSGKRNWQYGLWNVLMCQAWLVSNDN